MFPKEEMAHLPTIGASTSFEDLLLIEKSINAHHFRFFSLPLPGFIIHEICKSCTSSVFRLVIRISFASKGIP